MSTGNDDRMIRKDNRGNDWVLQNRWLRITYNPSNLPTAYPKTGDEIELRNHNLLGNGKFVVEQVTEFEPGVCRDSEGRDIRISLLGIGRDFNGENIVAAMVNAKGGLGDFKEGRPIPWARKLTGLFLKVIS